VARSDKVRLSVQVRSCSQYLHPPLSAYCYSVDLCRPVIVFAEHFKLLKLSIFEEMFFHTEKENYSLGIVRTPNSPMIFVRYSKGKVIPVNAIKAYGGRYATLILINSIRWI
jgi:hypothetical protein